MKQELQDKLEAFREAFDDPRYKLHWNNFVGFGFIGVFMLVVGAIVFYTPLTFLAWACWTVGLMSLLNGLHSFSICRGWTPEVWYRYKCEDCGRELTRREIPREAPLNSRQEREGIPVHYHRPSPPPPSPQEEEAIPLHQRVGLLNEEEMGFYGGLLRFTLAVVKNNWTTQTSWPREERGFYEKYIPSLLKAGVVIQGSGRGSPKKLAPDIAVGDVKTAYHKLNLLYQFDIDRSYTWSIEIRSAGQKVREGSTPSPAA